MDIRSFLSSLPANVRANLTSVDVNEPTKRIEILLKVEPLQCHNTTYDEAVRKKKEEVQMLAKELDAPREWSGYKIIYGCTDCCELPEHKQEEVYDMRGEAGYAGHCLAIYARNYMDDIATKGTKGQLVTLELVNWLKPMDSCMLALEGMPAEWGLGTLTREISGAFEEGFDDTENLIPVISILQFGLSQDIREKFLLLHAECTRKYASVKHIIDDIDDEEETFTTTSTPSDWDQVIEAKESVVAQFRELFAEHKTEILDLIREVASDPVNAPFELKLNPECVID